MALRTAEQSPSDFQSTLKHKLREVTAMVKQLFRKAGPYKKSTLVIFGWLTFFSSFFTANLALAIFLQSVARVLP